MNKKRSMLRSPGILLVALVVLVAATGLVYAHWTTTLRVDANVNTGNVYAEWLGAFTNDDGADNGDGELTTDEVYDHFGEFSSRDPSEPAFNGVRYDKDVAGCWAEAGGDSINVNVWNAYPSYHCAIQGEVANKGSIPLRVTAINANAAFEGLCGFWDTENWDEQNPGSLYEGDQIGWDNEGPFFDDNLDGDFNEGDYRLYEDCRSGEMEFIPGANQGNFALGFQGTPVIEGDIALGLNCGFQIDPVPCQWLFEEDDVPWDGHVEECGEGFDEGSLCAFDEDGNQGTVYESCAGPTYAANGWFHVLQEADQNVNYYWSLEQDFVNWNEWDASMCTIGSVVAHSDGTEYGIANGTSDPDPLP